MSASEFWGKKIICRSSLLWLFVEFPNFWKALVLWLGIGNPHLGGLHVFSMPVFILSIPERYRQSLLVAWPQALWGGTQLHSDIPAAAQTQWHFLKSWTTPSLLSVCWCHHGNQMPFLYVPLPHSAPSPAPLWWPPHIPPLLPRRTEPTG